MNIIQTSFYPYRIVYPEVVIEGFLKKHFENKYFIKLDEISNRKVKEIEDFCKTSLASEFISGYNSNGELKINAIKRYNHLEFKFFVDSKEKPQVYLKNYMNCHVKITLGPLNIWELNNKAGVLFTIKKAEINTDNTYQ